MRCWDRAALDLPAGPGDGGRARTAPGRPRWWRRWCSGCLGVSPRTAREAEIVRRGAQALHVTLDLDGPPGRAPCARSASRPGAGGACASTASRCARWPSWRARAVLVFLPDELRAVKGPPAARRRALDRVLEAAVARLRRGPGRLPARPGPAQRPAAAGARRARRRRTACRRGRRRWRALGARVAAARRAGVAALAGPVRRLAGASSAAARRAGCGWSRRRRRSPTSPTADLEEALAADPAPSAGPARSRPRRRSRGRTATTSGSAPAPADLRREGSQGEQRTAALAMLLAARDHLRARAARPILLLDDVLSELDPRRRRLLLEAVRDGGQTHRHERRSRGRRRAGRAPARRAACAWRTGACVADAARPAAAAAGATRRRAADVLARFRRRAGGRRPGRRGRRPRRRPGAGVVGRRRGRPQRPRAPHAGPAC